jgi:hypothetical protein
LLKKLHKKVSSELGVKRGTSAYRKPCEHGFCWQRTKGSRKRLVEHHNTKVMRRGYLRASQHLTAGVMMSKTLLPE